MNRNASNKVDISMSSTCHKKQMNRDQKSVQEGTELYFDPAMSLAELWKKVQVLLGRIWVALKYQFHKYTAGAFANMKFPTLSKTFQLQQSLSNLSYTFQLRLERSNFILFNSITNFQT